MKNDRQVGECGRGWSEERHRATACLQAVKTGSAGLISLRKLSPAPATHKSETTIRYCTISRGESQEKDARSCATLLSVIHVCCVLTENESNKTMINKGFQAVCTVLLLGTIGCQDRQAVVVPANETQETSVERSKVTLMATQTNLSGCGAISKPVIL